MRAAQKTANVKNTGTIERHIIESSLKILYFINILALKLKLLSFWTISYLKRNQIYKYQFIISK